MIGIDNSLFERDKDGGLDKIHQYPKQVRLKAAFDVYPLNWVETISFRR